MTDFDDWAVDETRRRQSRLLPGTIVADLFRIVRFLGEGKEGQVYLAIGTQTAEQVALKRIHSGRHTDQSVERYRQFISGLTTLRHPSIADHSAMFTDGGELYVASRYIEGFNLGDALGRQFSDIEIIRFAIRVSEAILSVHSANIVHGDISPYNIVLKDGDIENPIIIDFFAHDHLDGNANSSPNLLRTSSDDVYSLGTTILSLVNGPSDDDTTRSIAAPRLVRRPANLSNVPESVRPILSRMMDANSDARPNISEVLHQLQLAFRSAAPKQQFAETQATPLAIPPAEPAALQPTWEGGRLTLGDGSVASDIELEDVEGALSALQIDISALIEDLGTTSNVDPRFVSFLSLATKDIPETRPTKVEIFRLGHIEELLNDYQTIAHSEWPELLTLRYSGLLRQLRRIMLQFPSWRALKQNASQISVASEEQDIAAVAALVVAGSLRNPEGKELAEPQIADALEDLAQISAIHENPIAASQEAQSETKELLARDLLQSVNNIFKPVAEAAVLYAKGLGDGFKKAAGDTGAKDGERAFIWLRRLAIGTAASFGASSLLSGLASQFPNVFGWLTPLLKFLGGFG